MNLESSLPEHDDRPGYLEGQLTNLLRRCRRLCVLVELESCGRMGQGSDQWMGSWKPTCCEGVSVQVVLDEEHVVVVGGRLVGGLHDGVVVAQEVSDLRV